MGLYWCYKDRICQREVPIYEGRTAYKTRPGFTFGVQPIPECLTFAAKPNGGIKKELDRLFDLGFNMIHLDIYFLTEGNNLKEFLESKWVTQAKAVIPLLLSIGCAWNDPDYGYDKEKDSKRNRFNKILEELNKLPDKKKLFGLYIDEPVKSEKHFADCVRSGMVDEFRRLAHMNGMKFIVSGYYLFKQIRPYIWEEHDPEKDVPIEVAIEAGFPPVEYSSTWQIPYIKNKINPDGVLYTRYTNSNITATGKSRCLPITDWGDWIKEFSGESGAWINLGCHPDHYEYNVCCQKDYLHSILCFAMSTNISPFNDVKSLHLYTLDIIPELQRQFSAIYDLLNKYYSPPLCVSWHYTPERKIRELVAFAANAAKNGIPNLSRGIEPELFDLLTSPSTSLFRLINLVCNRALSNYKEWGQAQQDEDFLKILCSVYNRRLLQYRQAAIDCGWIVKVHETVQVGTKTEYCQRSSGKGPEIDCEKCIEWGKQPRAMCGGMKGIQTGDIFAKNFSLYY